VAFRHGVDEDVVANLIKFGMVIAECHKTEEAIRIFEAAIAYRENPIKPILCVGLALSYAERYNEAAAQYELACLRYPEFSLARALLASVLMRAKDPSWRGVADQVFLDKNATQDAIDMVQELVDLDQEHRNDVWPVVRDV
jgi:tetratricopeptide (TPR) repeat protein